MELNHLETKVYNVFYKVAVLLGFVPNRYFCEKLTNEFRENIYIHFQLFNTKNKFSAYFSISKRVNIIEDLIGEYMFDIGDEYKKSLDITTYSFSDKFVFKSFTNNYFSNKIEDRARFDISSEGLNKFESTARLILKEMFIPVSSKLNDLKYLDSLINSQPEIVRNDNFEIFNTWGIIYRRIILAKLTSNPKFSDICEYHRSFFDKYIEYAKIKGNKYIGNTPMVFEKIYDRLVNNNYS